MSYDLKACIESEYFKCSATSAGVEPPAAPEAGGISSQELLLETNLYTYTETKPSQPTGRLEKLKLIDDRYKRSSVKIRTYRVKLVEP